MGLEQAAGLQDVEARHGKYLGDEVGRGADGTGRVLHADSPGSDVQDLLQDLAARDALQLSLADGLQHGATGVPVRAFSADGVEKHVGVNEDPAHGAPRALVSEAATPATAPPEGRGR